MKTLQCNESITTSHENICVISKGVDVQEYKLDYGDAMRSLVAMKCRKMTKCWTCFCTKFSVVVIESEYETETWNEVWKAVKELYDSRTPKHPKTINENKKKFEELMDIYIHENSRILAELPKVDGTVGKLIAADKFSPYCKPVQTNRRGMSITLEGSFQDTSFEMSEIIEEGVNFLRVEASEIIAFVATDSDRICKPGIPPHLPIAYGLRGHSLNMKVMRNMVNDIRDELKMNETSVLCEVYDGQFHSLIVRSESGKALTRLQHTISNFKEMMNNNDKFDMVEKLLIYSDVSPDDKSEIAKLKFKSMKIEHLSTVKISMKKVLRTTGRRKNVIRKIFIETLPKGYYALKDIVTFHREELWRRYLKNIKPARRTSVGNVLTPAEIGQMIEGTKVLRRISKHKDGNLNESEIIEEEEDDPDYNPYDESQISDDSDVDLDECPEHNISNLSSTSSGQSCIKLILTELRKLNNKHDWRNKTIDTFIREFLSSKKNISKLFKYELDIINKQVFEFFGKNLFQKNDSKPVRVNKVFQQLRQMPQLLVIESSDEDNIDYFQPKSLLNIYRDFVTSKQYPKEYLAAPLCTINHMQSVLKWESETSIPIQVDLDCLEERHIIFNYPEFSERRNQLEMRTFDYTHILNNLRYHICNKGFVGVSKDAFINVSETNHDVLPRAIVEDKMDRQNSTISQRFFSEDVEQILIQNENDTEADFCQKTRNWFRACDERGLEIKLRLKYLHDMYDLLLSKCNMCDYPPPTTHIQGIPIRTNEAMLHTISTRFSLFGLSTNKSYNTRAISTLAVESFFSDLTRYEFSGLGAPKAVDIPKLISHVVHVNTTKHDPSRGFEFTTSTRDNYPTYLMEMDNSNSSINSYAPSAFDVKVDKKK